MFEFSGNDNGVIRLSLWTALITLAMFTFEVSTSFFTQLYSAQQWHMILNSTLETLFMVFVSGSFGFITGVIMGIFLWNKSPNGLAPSPFTYRFLSLFVNSGRSIPYIIFMVLLIPFTRVLVGSSIGTIAATLPLSLAAFLLYTRLAEETFFTTPKGLIEAGKVMGATHFQILRKIVLKEALPQLVGHLTNLMVMLIGFSAMAGAIGGGGLGDLAIRYGYQRYDLVFLALIVIVLIIMVQIVQFVGESLARRLRH